ncbi:MAG: cell division protein CrgA [Flaviflexus sp.]|uniref:Cell division protein CrgA n=1 Tax=Flaviflexus ciconiae TaxID=2496867 RepID=A0A3Q9G7Q6_9ACTO|nr:cell division protein CrgA [Flaviflexus ciconiae]AZQ77568.1 cell division protein CrgA [Flaviflexus ciconiae]
MPESRRRKAAVQKKRAQENVEIEKNRELKGSPRWWAPLMVGLMLLGLIIVVTAYVTGGNYPIGFDNGNYNLFLGFGVMLVGFLMTMGWK